MVTRTFKAYRELSGTGINIPFNSLIYDKVRYFPKYDTHTFISVTVSLFHALHA
ncbi:hypothetical protein DFO68_1014 [Halomonas ventosae]|uniref:Uncharacterized protein n=1 Tax=Halomonas ventosae TaxID=229007 RepID=A0A4R6I5T8_9GAMM|nr:hypothetical protein DFO68_1014 [Halomonas ventosae]